MDQSIKKLEQANKKAPCIVTKLDDNTILQNNLEERKTMNKILQIDEELRDLLPPLSQDAYDELEKNIIRDGCITPIALWNGLIADGHNRYDICSEHNIQFDTYNLGCENKDDVKDWMISVQLGRRNITVAQASYLRGIQYSREKVKQGTNNQYTQNEKPQNDVFHNTAQKLADQHNVSKATIERDAVFAKALDEIADSIGIEARNKILNEEVVISKEDVKILSKMDAETQKQCLIDNEDKKVKLPKVNIEQNKEIKITQEEITKPLPIPKESKPTIKNDVILLDETSEENKIMNEIGLRLKTSRSGEDNLNVEYEIQAIEGTAQNAVKSIYWSIFDNGIDLDKYLKLEHYKQIKTILEITKNEIQNCIIKMEEKINESK